jgi:hypothetical protein
MATVELFFVRFSGRDGFLEMNGIEFVLMLSCPVNSPGVY